MTIEAVILMLKGSKLDWAEVKKIMGKTDFIESVLNFNIETVKEKT